MSVISASVCMHAKSSIVGGPARQYVGQNLYGLAVDRQAHVLPGERKPVKRALRRLRSISTDNSPR